MKLMVLIICLISLFITNCGCWEGDLTGNTCGCSAGEIEDPWVYETGYRSDKECVVTLPPHVASVSFSGGVVIIDLANTASTGDQTKIRLTKDGITGSSVSFTLSGFPSSQITLTPNSTLEPGATYYIIFYPGAFADASSRTSARGVFNFDV